MDKFLYSYDKVRLKVLTTNVREVATGGSTLAELSPHHRRGMGLSPATLPPGKDMAKRMRIRMEKL
jgi:hypothetical protein